MADEFEILVKPIRNATAPGTLAALSLAALRIGDFPRVLKLGLLFASILFLLSAFFIFFYSVYSTKRMLWTCTALTFLLGLLSLIVSALSMLFLV